MPAVNRRHHLEIGGTKARAGRKIHADWKNVPPTHTQRPARVGSESQFRFFGCQVGTGFSESQSGKRAISAVLFHIRLTLRSTRSHTTTASLYTPLLAASETRECQTIGA